MKSYIELVQRILAQGQYKAPTRYDNDGNVVKLDNQTIAINNVLWEHNMDDGFPLLTTKFVPLRLIAVELEGFIKGITDKRWYQTRKTPIWDEWHNKNTGLEYDLGAIYGFQWRNLGGNYVSPPGQYNDDFQGAGKLYHPTFDQLKYIVDTVKSNPYDRRMVCSAWFPEHGYQQALPACHYAWGISAIQDTLNLHYEIRSNDIGLGAPFNIASYALLLLLLCKESGLKPGKVSSFIVDAHIYENHVEALKQQIEREPYQLPTVTIPDDNWKGILQWDHTQIDLQNYKYHPKIKMEVTV